jgi:hypothetical protein
MALQRGNKARVDVLDSFRDSRHAGAMPEAPLPPGALPLHALGCAATRPAWLDAPTFARMRHAARESGTRGDAAARAREVVAARYPAMPAALLTEAAALAVAASGATMP